MNIRRLKPKPRNISEIPPVNINSSSSDIDESFSSEESSSSESSEDES